MTGDVYKRNIPITTVMETAPTYGTVYEDADGDLFLFTTSGWYDLDRRRYQEPSYLSLPVKNFIPQED